uniref:Pseudouridine synthase RsuA/RluA-like domain-containing protein n=1 Tax=Mola mola TaxID=94237 RepID=A0A3Q3WGR7_MOLML
MESASLENLRVLYQSDDYIVVDKHWDIRIDSKMWYEKLTVQTQLRHHFPQLADPRTYYGFRFCHQLDYSTSGALCVALNKAAAGRAYCCFKDRTVTKAYLALVRSWLEEETLSLDFSIGKNSSEGKTHMMCIEGTEGCKNPKPCQTELTVLEYGLYDEEPATKVLLQPLTGRTHQLRVHCSAIGHPIVGDFTYSSGADDAPYRMMLHAHLLHIPLEPQPMLVCAGDPFLPAVDPKWLPQRLLRRPAATRAEEETEEQSRQCQEWLSEWAGD